MPHWVPAREVNCAVLHRIADAAAFRIIAASSVLNSFPPQTTGSPSDCVIDATTMREMTSVALPVPNAAIARIGLMGNYA